ncbi:MAG: hypothetical protein Q7U04_05985 [Bacteriovorax sp.]|nr:hypothetical protein [Bacteriovorax sp.]
MEQTIQATQLNQQKCYRFQIIKAQRNNEGKLARTKNVGMAYLMEGQETYTVRLWTFVNDKFFMVMNRYDSSKFMLMSRELNKNQQSRNKYFWNIIGSGKALSSQNVIELNFDLLPEPIYLSMFPEERTGPVVLPNVDGF